MSFKKNHKTLDTIRQWLEITASVINPLQQPVKIRIREKDSFLQHSGQRKSPALKKKY